jgi:2-oxoglutarate ferredoxin oxidoreductase subunit alpha
MTKFGGSHLLRFTTSSHDEFGQITKDPDELRKLNQHLRAKIEDHVDEITLVKEDYQEGATTLVICYGVVSRSVSEAVNRIRADGGKVSVLVIYSLFPVPEKNIRLAVKNIKKIILPELNLGQYRFEIERLTTDGQEIIAINCMDGTLITPNQILEAGGWL